MWTLSLRIDLKIGHEVLFDTRLDYVSFANSSHHLSNENIVVCVDLL